MMPRATLLIQPFLLVSEIGPLEVGEVTVLVG